MKVPLQAQVPALPPGDLRLLFEQAPSPYLVLAPDSPRFTIVGVNAAYLSATRTVRENLIGRGLFESFPDDPGAREATGMRNLRASLERALATRRPDTMTPQHYPIPRPGGGFEERYWSPINSPVLGDGGEVRYLLHHVEDVTEVMRLTREGEADRGALGLLRAQGVERQHLLELGRLALARAELERRRLYAAFDHAPLGIAIFRGPRHVIEYVNPYEARLWGRAPETVLGRPLAEALPELAAQGIVEEQWDSVYRTGVPRTMVELPVRFDRKGTGELEEGYFNVVHVPLRDPEGRVDGFMVIARDETETVLARGRAETVTTELQERASFERQLIGIVSHDLRNPLNAIQLSATALARREHLDPRDAKVVLRLQSSAERAIQLVEDLLDFTRARVGGGIPIQVGSADLHALTREVVEEVEAAYPGRVIQVHDRGDVTGIWDARRLAQVVQNLIANALQYSPEDSVVQVTTRGAGSEVSLCIHNDGPPIPPHLAASLFEPMQRGNNQEDSPVRSIGLGLYIVKHLVDAHGGTISVSSDQSGTTISVRLPRYPPVHGAAGEASQHH